MCHEHNYHQKTLSTEVVVQLVVLEEESLETLVAKMQARLVAAEAVVEDMVSVVVEEVGWQKEDKENYYVVLH